MQVSIVRGMNTHLAYTDFYTDFNNRHGIDRLNPPAIVEIGF